MKLGAGLYVAFHLYVAYVELKAIQTINNEVSHLLFIVELHLTRVKCDV